MQIQTDVTRYFVFIFLALFAVTQFPLYWVQYPDIVDFPNHLARLHILINLSESETLQQYYTLRHLKVGTNLAMEVLVPLLAKGMSLMLALKVFASLTMFLVTTGAIALGRVIHGQTSYLLLGVLFFAQNAMFQLGLLNYLFGLGLAFWLLAAWIYARNYSSLFHWLAFSTGCILVYVCHLSAFGVYAVCVLGYELGCAQFKGGLTSRSALKALLLPLTQFFPVIALHLLVSVSTGTYTPVSVEYSLLELIYIWLKSELLLLVISPSICVSGYVLGPNIFAVFIVCALYIGFREGVLKLTTPAKWMASMLAICILLLPHAGFGSRMLDVRLIPALGLILWSGLDIPKGRELKPNALLGVIAAIVFLISLETGREWVLRDGEYSRVRAALQQIPEGSKVATIILNKPGSPDSISAHVGAFSVIDRSTLLSNMFIWPFQPYWVAYREHYVSLAILARLDDPATYSPEYEDIKGIYNYVLIFGGKDIDRMQYCHNAETLFSSTSVTLIRTDLSRPVKANVAGGDTSYGHESGM
jgi:hypothetical protein